MAFEIWGRGVQPAKCHMAKTRGALGDLEMFVSSLRRLVPPDGEAGAPDRGGACALGKASGVSREKHQGAPFGMQTFAASQLKLKQTL